jgi:hypothetical protein
MATKKKPYVNNAMDEADLKRNLGEHCSPSAARRGSAQMPRAAPIDPPSVLQMISAREGARSKKTCASSMEQLSKSDVVDAHNNRRTHDREEIRGRRTTIRP